MFRNVARGALGAVAVISLLSGMMLSLSACGGGSPMTVEQRYSEPKTQDEVLQERVDAARRTERAHGAL